MVEPQPRSLPSGDHNHRQFSAFQCNFSSRSGIRGRNARVRSIAAKRGGRFGPFRKFLPIYGRLVPLVKSRNKVKIHSGNLPG